MRDRVLGVALGLLALLAGSVARAGEYFLDGAQQRDLLLYGRITGRDEARYDIWIVPGYVPPSRHIGTGWKSAGDDLDAYTQPKYYDDTLQLTRKAMRYARKDILREFAFRGTGEAWADAVANANRRVGRRVFGWQLAWPWAVVVASTESVGRLGIGVPGAAATWAGAAVGIPATALVFPMVMSGAHALGEGTAWPLAAAGWNTAIAPPLALLGQQPAPERADGWWMKRLADPAAGDMQARLAAWQQGWQAEPPLKERHDVLTTREGRHAARVAELKAQLAAEEKGWADEQSRLESEYQRLALQHAMAGLPALREEMARHGYTPARLEAEREALVGVLVSGGLAKPVAERVVSALAGHPAGRSPARGADDKIDPLLEALERGALR